MSGLVLEEHGKGGTQICQELRLPAADLGYVDLRKYRDRTSPILTYLVILSGLFGERDGARTHDLLIKSGMPPNKAEPL